MSDIYNLSANFWSDVEFSLNFIERDINISEHQFQDVNGADGAASGVGDEIEALRESALSAFRSARATGGDALRDYADMCEFFKERRMYSAERAGMRVMDAAIAAAKHGVEIADIRARILQTPKARGDAADARIDAQTISDFAAKAFAEIARGYTLPPAEWHPARRGR